MATAATVHSHAPQGFIRKYIFSLDHKVIGIQYFFLALTAVFVGMFLSLLMRVHMIWPTANWPLVGEIKPETYLAFLTMHGTIMVFFVLTTAPHPDVRVNPDIHYNSGGESDARLKWGKLKQKIAEKYLGDGKEEQVCYARP